MKIAVLGDLHLRFDKPRNRKDTYYEDVKNKFVEFLSVCKNNQVDCIIQLGDFFDKPVLNNFEKLFSDYHEVIKKYNIPIYALIGNHDTYKKDGDTYGTAFGVFVDSGLIIPLRDIDCSIGDFKFKALSYHNRNERLDLPEEKNSIVFIHDYILPSGVEKHIKEQRNTEGFKSKLDTHFIGHYHKPLTYQNTEKKLFLNPGSFTRNTIADLHNPTFFIIEVENNKLKDINSVSVNCNVEPFVVSEEKKEDFKLGKEFIDMLKNNDTLVSEFGDIDKLLKDFKIEEKLYKYIKEQWEKVK